MIGAQWVWLAVALPLAGFLVNGALALRRGPATLAVSIVGPGVLLGAFAVSAGVFLGLLGQPSDQLHQVTLWSWMPAGSLQVDLAFQVDRLSAVMLLVVTGVGSLIHLFSVGYMREDPGYARYFAYLNLFVVFMLVLVLGANFPVLFIGWEGVGLCSYLLIGFWFTEEANADAGKKAFIMNRIGDFGVLVAMFFLWRELGTLDFSQIAARAPGTLEPGGAIAKSTLVRATR
jgi:NADH-quinone oxidoreductase subunit L